MAILLEFVIIIFIEFFLAIAFHFFSPKFLRKKSIDYSSVAKGLLERTLLTVALLSGFPHVLTLFGALKLGTRLKRKDTEDSASDEAKYNDYYLIGNFISVLVSILYYNLFQWNIFAQL